MKNMEQSSNYRLLELKEGIIDATGEKLHYRLLMLRNPRKRRYAINVRKGSESCLCGFGEDKKKAYEIFDLIVRNTVTPCTLCDIAKDFAQK